MPHRVLVTRRILPAPRAELETLFELDYHDTDVPLAPDELRERARGAAGIVSVPGDQVDGALLDAAGPGLRLVAHHAVGYDGVDVAAASERGVLVTNTPDVLTETTAEFTLALLLALVRRVAEGDRLIRARTPWRFSLDFMLGAGLAGRTLGIVGLGRIGRDVGRLAEAFGMEVVYTSPTPKELGWERLELPDLLARADVVSLHCALTPETRHLIDAAALRAMKPGAFLVNVSRGPVVDERALVEALRAGEIAGAALDVYEREPEVEEGLLGFDNVVLTPHIGSGTHGTREAMGMLCVHALRAVLLEGRVPPNALNPEARR